MNLNIDGYIWFDLGKVRYRLVRFRFKKCYFLFVFMYFLILWMIFYICIWVKRIFWFWKRLNVGMFDIFKSEEKVIDFLVILWKIVLFNKLLRFCRKCSVFRIFIFLCLIWNVLVCNYVKFIILDVCGKLFSWNIWCVFLMMFLLGRVLWKIRIVIL